MGVDVARTFPAARECFDRASAVVGFDVLRLCETGSEDELRETRVSQPAIFTTNVAIYRAVESLGYQPLVSAGHSFGEYCSLTIAGAIAFDRAVDLVNRRGLAMGEAADLAPGAMAAIIGFSQAQVEDVCRKARAQTHQRVDLANLNAPAQIVVSGDRAAVEQACDVARSDGAKRVVVLNVSGAWHSELMEPAMRSFASSVEAAPIGPPRFSVVSNVDVAVYESVEQIRRCLIASLCSRVRWHETALVLAAMSPDIIVECGATRVLAPMMARLPGVDAARVVHVADAAGIAKLAAAADFAA